MRGLWGRRIVALVIDAAIITLFLWVLMAVLYPLIALLNIFPILSLWLPLTAFLIIYYFTYFENKYRVTPGKNVMKLRVQSLKGNMNNKKAFIRNLSKIFWFPLIIDIIIGFAIGKTRERFLDHVANTEVVDANKESILRSNDEEIVIERDN